MRLPLAASPAGASCAKAMADPLTPNADTINAIRAMFLNLFIGNPSTRIGDDVDHGRLTSLDRSDGAGERRPKILGIGNRTLAIGAAAARKGGVVDIRILERGADVH